MGRDHRPGSGALGTATATMPALRGRTVLGALLAFFAVVIAVNGVMVVLAIATMPGLDTERPYQTGIAYNAEIAAARAQAGRHWAVASRVVRDLVGDPPGHAAVTVTVHDATGTPVSGLDVAVRLLRPTDQRGDHAVTLHEGEPGTYRGDATSVAAGAWEVETRAGRGSEPLFRSHNRIILD